MYNPGYWVNRISHAQISEWRWIRKHNRLVGGFLVIYLTISLIAIGQVLKVQISEPDATTSVTVIPLVVFFVIMWIFCAFIFLQKPITGDPGKESAIDAHLSKSHKIERKKKLPKRRKDYR